MLIHCHVFGRVMLIGRLVFLFRLTAYVVRSFARAKHFVPDTVDNNVLNKAVLFILSSQNADGSFNETGMVHHSEMQVCGVR